MAGQIHKTIQGPVKYRLTAGNPRIIGIFTVPVTLGNFFTGFKNVVHCGDKMLINQVIGIKNAEGIINIIFFKYIIKELRKGGTLRFNFSRTGHNLGTVLKGDFFGIVSAIIGNNIHIHQFLRIILLMKTFDQITNNRRFISCSNHHSNAVFGWGEYIFIVFSIPKYSDT